jgi:hypothetical protein
MDYHHVSNMTLGLGVELGQCSKVCLLLFVPGYVMAYYSLYSYAKDDLINIKEGNVFKQEDLIIIMEGSLFVCFVLPCWVLCPLGCTKVCS